METYLAVIVYNHRFGTDVLPAKVDIEMDPQDLPEITNELLTEKFHVDGPELERDDEYAEWRIYPEYALKTAPIFTQENKNE